VANPAASKEVDANDAADPLGSGGAIGEARRVDERDRHDEIS
jgi:hypothetical protein